MTAGLVRLVIDLEKARKHLQAHPGQLSLFGGGAPGKPPTPTTAARPPAPTTHVELHPVTAHVRHTEHGLVQVAPHERHVHVVAVQPAPSAPEPIRQPAPEPEPPAPEEPIQIVPPVTGSPTFAIPGAPLEPPTPAPAPATTPGGTLVPDDQPAQLPAYHYRHAEGGAPLWMPEGTTEEGGIYRTPAPLSSADAWQLGLQACDADGKRRPWDAYESGSYEVTEYDTDGEPYQAQRFTSGKAPKELFSPLEARYGGFLAKFEELERRAKRLGLDPPQMFELGKVLRRVPVALIGWGQDARVEYDTLPAKLIRVINPQLKVKGWTLGAVVKPMPGTKYTQVTAIGKPGGELPKHLHTTGMHCDHCGTDRDRSFVVALRNDTTGQWKQVGGSCLADFTGRSASNLATVAEFLKDWDKQEGELDEPHEGGGRGPALHEWDDVLMAALRVVDEDGGYVSAATASEQGIKSTAQSVRDLLESPTQAAATRARPGLIERSAAVRAWLKTLPDPATEKTSDYNANLFAIGQATGVPAKSVGLAVSAVSAYQRAQQAAAFARLPSEHFGGAGDKIGRKVSKKDKAAGIGEHTPIRVRVTGSHSFDGQFGTTTILTMRDGAGHVFKWKASGSPSHANAEANGLPYGNLRDIVPGEQFDLVGTIKGHSEYKGTRQTDITRAELHRAYSPSERAELVSQAAAFKQRALERPALLRQLAAEFEAESPRIEADVRERRPHLGYVDGPTLWGQFVREKLRTDPTIFERADWHDPQRPPLDYAIRSADRLAAAPTLDQLANEHAQQVVKDHAALKIREPVEPDVAPLVKGRPMPGAPRSPGSRRPAAPAPPSPSPSPAYSPGPHGAVPPTPGQHVKFKHPTTGQEEEGHIHGQPGAVGATIVDGQGTTHRVPHGHYMHVADSGFGAGGQEGDAKPSAELVKAATVKHLELGPTAPLAIYATAAWLSIGGVSTVHELQASDVRIVDGCLYVDKDKKKTDNPAIVQMVSKLQHDNAKGPLFVVNGKPMDEQGLTAYVRRFGMHHGGSGSPPPGAGSSTPPGAPPPPGPTQPLAKASAAALVLPVSLEGKPIATWKELGDLIVEFRKGRDGIGVVSIDGPSLPVPLHEICGTEAKAREFARTAAVALNKGEAPPRGIFQATR